MAEELGVPFKETSAKSGINIDEIFDDIIERIDKEFGDIQKVTKNLSYQAKGRRCCYWKINIIEDKKFVLFDILI